MPSTRSIPGYAKNVGVDVDELLVSQPDTGEQALEIAETLIRSGGVDVVIVDSVAALVPRAEIEGDMGDAFVGLQARLMSQALRKLTGAINRSQTALIFTNQLREKIGVMFGSPETTPGGRALKFYASVRMDIRRIETLKTGTDAIGSRTRVKVVKNKVASPFRVAEFDIMYNEGISVEGGLLDVGIAAGILSKTGAWFNYGDMRLGQGRENSRDFLKQNPEIAAEDRRRDSRQGREHRGRPSRASARRSSASDGARDAEPAQTASRPRPTLRRDRGRRRDSSARAREPVGDRAERLRRAKVAEREIEAALDASDRARLPGRRGLRAMVGRAARPARASRSAHDRGRAAPARRAAAR